MSQVIGLAIAHSVRLEMETVTAASNAEEPVTALETAMFATSASSRVTKPSSVRTRPNGRSDRVESDNSILTPFHLGTRLKRSLQCSGKA